MAVLAQTTAARLRNMFQTLSSGVTDGPLGIFSLVKSDLNLVILSSPTATIDSAPVGK
ncbi:MAG TPA: hypothetical protein VL087_09965 [Nitrospirota bacterium]|nr:hypothetical protein [Nitrospirota bacterium]